jgi:hypothetical protein
MTDYEYQKTLMIGVIIGVAFTLLGFYMLKPSPENHTVTPKTNFAVIHKRMRCSSMDRRTFGNLSYFLTATTLVLYMEQNEKLLLSVLIGTILGTIFMRPL